MTDIGWFIVLCVVFVSVGLLMVRLGWLIWKKQKIELLHIYHYDKVKEEDKGAFCCLCGIGTCLAGAGLVVSGILTVISGNLLSLAPMVAGLVICIAMMILALAKYNR